MAKKVGIYMRVSTSDQDTEAQRRELLKWALNAGLDVVEVYEDKGISGAKGRDKRPGLDALLKDAVRRKIDMIAVWSADRLARSLIHLIEVLQTIRATGTDLYIHTQGVDTSTPAGRAMFQMLGVFAEFEREMIVARVNSGIAKAKATGTKSGKPFGRPRVSKEVEEKVRVELARGTGIQKTARLCGIGAATVQRIRSEANAVS